MVLIKIESLSRKELEHIALQEGVAQAPEMSRDELIDVLKDIYDDESGDDEQGEANIQRRFVTWLTDYRGDGSELTSLPGVEELPESYNETSIHVMMKNPTWLYCYWSLSPLDAEHFSGEGSWRLLLHVTLNDTDGSLLDSYDIAVDGGDSEWNINISANHGTAMVSLEVELADRSRRTLARSVRVPLVSCYWLEHPDEMAQDADLLRRQLGLLTNREGGTIPCETVDRIVEKLKEEGIA